MNHLNPQINFKLPIFPFLSVLGAIFIGIIELKSIYEKADDKDKGKYQEAIKLVAKVLESAKDKDGIDRLLAILKSNENEQRTEE